MLTELDPPTALGCYSVKISTSAFSLFGEKYLPPRYCTLACTTNSGLEKYGVPGFSIKTTASCETEKGIKVGMTRISNHNARSTVCCDPSSS